MALLLGLVFLKGCTLPCQNAHRTEQVSKLAPVCSSAWGLLTCPTASLCLDMLRSTRALSRRLYITFFRKDKYQAKDVQKFKELVKAHGCLCGSCAATSSFSWPAVVAGRKRGAVVAVGVVVMVDVVVVVAGVVVDVFVVVVVVVVVVGGVVVLLFLPRRVVKQVMRSVA